MKFHCPYLYLIHVACQPFGLSSCLPPYITVVPSSPQWKHMCPRYYLNIKIICINVYVYKLIRIYIWICNNFKIKIISILSLSISCSLCFVKLLCYVLFLTLTAETWQHKLQPIIISDFDFKIIAFYMNMINPYYYRLIVFIVQINLKWMNKGDCWLENESTYICS